MRKENENGTADLLLVHAGGREILIDQLNERLDLFDTDPPAIENASNNFNGDQGYDSFNASARGRYISFSVRKQW